MRILAAVGIAVLVACAGAHQPPATTPAPAAEPAPPRVTQAQLDELGKLIDAAPDDGADKPALRHHRAELYLRQSAWFAAHPEVADAAKKRSQWQLAGAKELLDTTRLPGFRSYPRADEVLFSFLRELLLVNQAPEARKICKRLMVDYPDSEYIPDAFFALGEFHFAQHDYQTAARYYEKVLDFGESRVSDAARRQLEACARQP
jgi:TolA-binding protein